MFTKFEAYIIFIPVCHSVHGGGGMRGRGGMRGWWGACVVVGGGLRRIGRDTVNERAVRILLECILVCYINAPKTIKRYRLPSFL